MSRFPSESVFRNSVPTPPSTSINLPFATSFGPPTPVSNNIGVPFQVSGGTPFSGPTTFINKSITQHFVTSYDVNNNCLISSEERVSNLKVGDLVFARTRSGPARFNNPECILKFPTIPGATTVELFNITQLNDWLKERCYKHEKFNLESGYYKNASELLQEFCFLGSIKNTVDANGRFGSVYGNKNTSRMLNLVVSKKASTLNIFPYVTLGAQDLWFIIKKIDVDNSKNENGKRTRDYGAMSSTKPQKTWAVIPWTDPNSSRPSLRHLAYKEDDGQIAFGTCVHVGKASDTCLDFGSDYGSKDDDYELTLPKIKNIIEKRHAYVTNNLEMFIKV